MACHKNETRDLGRLQVGPREPGTGTPKCLGGTWDPRHETPKYSSRTRDLGPI